MKKYTRRKNQKGGLSIKEQEIFDSLFNIQQESDVKKKQEIIDNTLQELTTLGIDGYTDITHNTPFRPFDYYINQAINKNDTTVYSETFIEYMRALQNIILTNDTEQVKYTLIGKAFRNFTCKKNNYKNRFATFVLDIVRIRIYNKKILQEKLRETITNIIRNIGYCDNSVIEKNIIPRCLRKGLGEIFKKLSQVSNETYTAANDFIKSSTEEEQVGQEEDCPENYQEGTQNSRLAFTIVDQIRSDASLLITMYKSGFVSNKEFVNREIINPGSMWLVNPAFLTAATTAIKLGWDASTAANHISAAVKHTAPGSGRDLTRLVGQKISHQIINIALISAGAAGASIVGSFAGTIAIPVIVFGGYYAYNKYSETDFNKNRERSYKVGTEFRKYTNDWIKNYHIDNKTINDCNLVLDVDNYFNNFIRASKLIKEYKDQTHYFDDSDTLFTYSISAYKIICQESLASDVSPNEKLDIINEPKLLQQTSQTPDIDKIISKLSTGQCADYMNDSYVKFKNLTLEQKKHILENYTHVNDLDTIKRCSSDVPPQSLIRFIQYLDENYFMENQLVQQPPQQQQQQQQQQQEPQPIQPLIDDFKYNAIINQLDTCKSSAHDSVKSEIQNFLNRSRDEQIQILSKNIDNFKFNTDNTIDLCRTPNMLNNMWSQYIKGGRKSRKLRKQKTQKRRKGRKTRRQN